MTKAKKSTSNEVTKKESAKSANVSKANENLIVNSLSIKHNIEGRKNKSAKELKAERSRNRSALIKFANQNFLASHAGKKEEQLSNAKAFISYIKNHYLYVNLSFSANDLYKAKEAKTISDIQNLIDFCKSAKLQFKVYEDLKA